MAIIYFMENLEAKKMKRIFLTWQLTQREDLGLFSLCKQCHHKAKTRLSIKHALCKYFAQVIPRKRALHKTCETSLTTFLIPTDHSEEVLTKDMNHHTW